MHGGYNSVYEKQKPVLRVHGVYEHDSAQIAKVFTLACHFATQKFAFTV